MIWILLRSFVQLLVKVMLLRNGLLDIRRSVNELKPDALEHLSLEVAITKMITDMNSNIKKDKRLNSIPTISATT